MGYYNDFKVSMVGDNAHLVSTLIRHGGKDCDIKEWMLNFLLKYNEGIEACAKHYAWKNSTLDLACTFNLLQECKTIIHEKDKYVYEGKQEKCKYPWDEIMEGLYQICTVLDVDFMYARIGEDLDDIEEASNCEDWINIIRKIE